jgi:hypothetical protein
VLTTAICMFYFSRQSLFVVIFLSINVYPGTPEICAEMYVGLHIECPLLLFDLNQNWKVSKKNRKNFPESDFMKSFQHCSIFCMQTERQTYIANIILFICVY